MMKDWKILVRKWPQKRRVLARFRLPRLLLICLRLDLLVRFRETTVVPHGQVVGGVLTLDAGDTASKVCVGVVPCEWPKMWSRQADVERGPGQGRRVIGLLSRMMTTMMMMTMMTKNAKVFVRSFVRFDDFASSKRPPLLSS